MSNPTRACPTLTQCVTQGHPMSHCVTHFSLEDCTALVATRLEVETPGRRVAVAAGLAKPRGLEPLKT